MALYKPGSSSSTALQALPGRTEFEILKASHKFLRDDDQEPKDLTWEEQVAQKYYSRLYREYALCDLKHYKSGNFALRWRTEEEVISGAGETTCGNTRCSRHFPRNIDPDDPRSSLTTLELPFSYMEDGEGKFALVKVVLCSKCCKKLMWKRNKEKEKEKEQGQAKEGELQVKQESEAGDDDIILGRLGAEEPGGGRAAGETRTAEISGSADARSSRQREKAKTQSTDQPDVADPERILPSRRSKHTTGVDSREGHHRERHRRSSRSRSPRRGDAEPRRRPRSPS